MTQSWGPPARCTAIDPSGEQCALVEGHAGNHLTRDDAPRPPNSYVKQIVAIFVLANIVAFVALLFFRMSLLGAAIVGYGLTTLVVVLLSWPRARA